MPKQDIAEHDTQPPSATTTAGERFKEVAREAQAFIDRYVETVDESNTAFAAYLARLSEASADMVKEAIKNAILTTMGYVPLPDDPDDLDEEAGS